MKKRSAATHQRSSKKRGLIGIGPSYRRRLRNLSLALVVVLTTAFSLVAFVMFQRLSKSITSASSGVNLADSINSNGRFSLLLGKVDEFKNQTSPISDLLILTIELSSRKAGIYRLPVDLEVSNLGGFGLGKIYSLYGLANLTEPKDLNFIARQVQEVFLVPIDGFLLTDRAGFDRLSRDFGSDLGLSRIRDGDYAFFLRRVTSLPLLFSSLKTNLGLVELLKIFSRVIANRFNQFELGALLPGLQNDTFFDTKVEEDGKKIIVLNGTRVPLLASMRSNLITNIGGHVLEAANAPGDPYPESLIVSNDRDSYTLKRLAKVLKISDVRTTSSFEDDSRLAPFLRADLVVILGLDSLNYEP